MIKDITITGSNGEFVVTFKHILNLGTYTIYSTCTNNARRKSLPSLGFKFTVATKIAEPLTNSTIKSAVNNLDKKILNYRNLQI